MKATFSLIVLLFLVFTINAQNGVTKLGSLSHFKLIDLRGQSGIAIDDTNRIWMSYYGIKNTKFYPSNIGLITFGSDSVWKQISLDSLGGPSTIYFSSIQFQKGALWLGSDKGLIKKKGNTFTVFTHPQSNPNADTVNNFVIKGNVYYMATQSGIHICYNTAFGNSWTKYDTTNTSLPTNSINALDIDSKGIFWLATNIGVIRFDPIKNETKIYSKKESEFWTDKILSIKVLPNDEVWAGSENRNVFKVGLFLNEYNTPGLFHFNQNKFINYLSEIGLCDLKIIPSSTFSQILNEGNNIWFSAYINNSHGIFMTDGSNVLIKKLTTVASSNGNFIATKKGNSLLISGYFQGYDRIKIDLNDTKLDSNYIAFSIRKNTSTSPYEDIPANLEINNLNVPLLIDGDLFWNFDNSTLKVKSSKCNSIALAGGIWMGGMSEGNLHLAAASYRQSGRDYGKGPLKIGNFTNNNESQLKFQSTWKVEEKTINEFKLNFNKPGDEREVTFALVYTPTNFNQKDLILEELNKDVIKVKNGVMDICGVF
jgi:hypothetical protein